MSRAWLERRVLVTVGTGGVGKTTVSAALALAAAKQGRRALVVTIDPARRLADTLGIEGLGSEIHRVSGAGLGGGELYATTLDTKRTFDELVERYAPDPETARRIFANPLYRQLSDALAGSREYSAMEKLHQLYTEGEFDPIVLDTPPAAHALEFLDAPRRLTGFLESPMLRLLLRPAFAVGRTGFRVFRAGSEAALAAIERITGMEFLRMLSEFVLTFESLWDGVTERAHEIEKLLRRPETGFLLVAGPDPVQARRAREFLRRLEDEQIRLAGLVLNRMHVWPSGQEPPGFGADARRALASALAGLPPPTGNGAGAGLAGSGGAAPLSAREAALWAETVARFAARSARDRQAARHWLGGEGLPNAELCEIPLFPEGVHALDTLERVASYLVPEASRA